MAAWGTVRLPQRQRDKLALRQESMVLRLSRRCRPVLPLASGPAAQLRWALNILSFLPGLQLAQVAAASNCGCAGNQTGVPMAVTVLQLVQRQAGAPRPHMGAAAWSLPWFAGGHCCCLCTGIKICCSRWCCAYVVMFQLADMSALPPAGSPALKVPLDAACHAVMFGALTEFFPDDV